MKRLTEAIKLILRAQSVLEDVDRDMVDVEQSTSGVGLPTPKEQLRDCLDSLDNLKEILEDLQV